MASPFGHRTSMHPIIEASAAPARRRQVRRRVVWLAMVGFLHPAYFATRGRESGAVSITCSDRPDATAPPRGGLAQPLLSRVPLPSPTPVYRCADNPLAPLG